MFLYTVVKILLVHFLSSTITATNHQNCRNGAQRKECLPVAITDNEIAQLSETMWNEDSNMLPIQLALQGRTSPRSTKDKAPEPLCRNIPKELTTTAIYKTFTALFDNYLQADSKPEEITSDEWKEVDAFLKEAMRTQPIKTLQNFLVSKGLKAASDADFQAALKRIWYSLYRRSNALSSSGAEHVLIGETKSTKVSGLHNWVRFCLLEKDRKINYLGYVQFVDLGDGRSYIAPSFYWDQHHKPVSGFFVGTSPAFDLAVFTLCFYARPNDDCSLKLGGKKVNVFTHIIAYHGKTYVGSAFPDMKTSQQH